MRYSHVAILVSSVYVKCYSGWFACMDSIVNIETVTMECGHIWTSFNHCIVASSTHEQQMIINDLQVCCSSSGQSASAMYMCSLELYFMTISYYCNFSYTS